MQNSVCEPCTAHCTDSGDSFIWWNTILQQGQEAGQICEEDKYEKSLNTEPDPHWIGLVMWKLWLKCTPKKPAPVSAAKADSAE